MVNTHDAIIKDTDPQFIIDPLTRKLSTASTKITLVKGDHKSERFTFEVPYTVEGHPMDADKVIINYVNIDQLTKETSPGIWEADDITLVDTEGVEYKKGQDTISSGTTIEKIKFSWLIEYQATQYQGVLNFMVRFVCYNDDGVTIKYSWGTSTYAGIQIVDSIDGSGMTTEEYIDVLRQWENDIKQHSIQSMTQTRASTEDNGENEWTIEFANGSKSTLIVRNGSRGPTSLVGSIETIISKKPIHFFEGTKAEYLGLSEEERKGNLFAVITDENPLAQFTGPIESLTEDVGILNKAVADTLEDGTPVMHYAKELAPANTVTTLEDFFEVEKLKFGDRQQKMKPLSAVKLAFPKGACLVHVSFDSGSICHGAALVYFDYDITKYGLTATKYYNFKFEVYDLEFEIIIHENGVTILNTPAAPQYSNLKITIQKIC